MIDILHFNIQNINLDEMNFHFLNLPSNIRKDILRYKNINDQKRKLVSKLMLFDCLLNDNAGELINDLKINTYNKPYIEKWNFFNTSHSEDIVTFVYGKTEIGIDIEKNNDINFMELIDHFHPKEKQFIKKSKTALFDFYKIWVKKESFLKALGIGLSEGLSKFNCLDEGLLYNGVFFYFHKVDFSCEYQCYLCSSTKSLPININQFSLKNLKTKLK